MTRNEGKWPPVYDEEDLKRVIARHASSLEESAAMYASLLHGGVACQGDVLAMEAPLPVFDSDGAIAIEESFKFWQVIGNTCDIDRSISEVTYTQIVPILEISADVMRRRGAGLRQYLGSREFFLPPWPGASSTVGYVADFVRPVSLHKAAIGARARVVARLSFEGWILLHSAMVRFLARGDGRFDP